MQGVLGNSIFIIDFVLLVAVEKVEVKVVVVVRL